MREATITPEAAALLIFHRADQAPREIQLDFADFRSRPGKGQGDESQELATWAEAELRRIGIEPPDDDAGNGSQWWALFWATLCWVTPEDASEWEPRELRRWYVTAHGVVSVAVGGLVEVEAATAEEAQRKAAAKFANDPTLWESSDEDRDNASVSNITTYDPEVIG